MQSGEHKHQWRFFRSGGFDQVLIDNVGDLRHLGELDQKLWTVLACPSTGLEFDARTLRLLDQDGDGYIRAPEIIAAAQWLCEVLKTPEVLFEQADSLPLAAINEAHEQGASLLATAHKVLGYVGKADADQISIDDFADPALLFAADHPNGDGIVPAQLAPTPALAAAIERIIAHTGAVEDRSGEAGIDEERVRSFFASAAEVIDWHQQAEAGADSVLVLGDGTTAAAAALEAVRDKIDDFFTRCRLAAYDGRAASLLNPAEDTYAELALKQLGAGNVDVAALPLAQIGSANPLPLVQGINPAWQEAVDALRSTVVEPLLGSRETLSWEEWQDLLSRFDAYRGWFALRPQTTVADIDLAELRALVAADSESALLALIEADLAAETAAAQVDTLEQLVRYSRHFVTLTRNFVSLSDFYQGREKAIFQAGTLYLDQRSCQLCLRVSNVDRHQALAPLSASYLVYCECVRHDEEPMQIVAALTGGDADEMLVAGRNGVFYDRQGRDWSATVTQVVEAPISVRQAFWSPYQRIARMISEQIQKFAAARDGAVDSGAADAISGAAEAPPAPPFDIAKFAGIFAAIGLALGALGTALAAVVSGFLSLPAWQMPLVVLGIMLLISGPSVLMAWFKLRQRNLGPLLDANGWAINTRARINIPFGGALTQVASLPAGSRHASVDLYAERKTPWRSWLFLIAVIALALVMWQQGVYDRFLSPPEVAVQTEPAEAEPAAADPVVEPDEAAEPAE